MKAASYTRFGPASVVEVCDVERPAPGADEVLIRVHAASVNPLDWRLIRGASGIVRLLFRLNAPTVARPGRPGRDVAGRVEAVGAGVTRFAPGDEVFGTCRGAFAEYACAAESALTPMPPGVTFEQAASVPVAGLTALQGLRDKGRIAPGRSVLVNGAAGGVGTFAVQIARSFGAEVTGVCSARNVDLVRSLGADRVVDYVSEDVTAGDRRFDLILDCVGNLSLSAYRRLLNPRGIAVIVGAPKDPGPFLARALAAPVLSALGSRTLVTFIARMRKDDLAAMADLIATGRVKPVIDRRYPLAEASDALAYLEEGHARGKVVIVVD
jgi:NADPH:quinone reductase-like Zn-dependent oxidoreductase